MKVRVKLFAILRDQARRGELELELPTGSTVATARAELERTLPTLAPYLPRVAYALNRSYVSTEAALKDGDELALIPPVSGGSK